jgi:CheY-like chemotaxis protein
VLLTVSDTGCGMTEEVRSRLFEPFFTTKQKDRGNGLGLATVAGTVRQLGGHITVSSEPDRGSTFQVSFPCAGEPVPVPVTVPAGSPRSTATLLLVEDEVSVRVLVRETLRKRGYTILEASGAVEAVQLGERYTGPIHLLVSDVHLPGGMSGVRLAERLTASRPDMRTLFLSGFPDAVEDDCESVGRMANFLAKPFSIPTLIRKVQQILAQAAP